MNKSAWILGAVLVTSALGGCVPKWGEKGEERLCESAIAGRIAWPSDKCRAMSVCANSAQLTEAQRAQLAGIAMEHRCAAF